MQPWRRWREPLAIVLLVALALMLVVRVVAFGLTVEAGNAGAVIGSIPGGDDLLLLGTAAAVLWCATPVLSASGDAPGFASHDQEARPETELSPHARPIAVAGLVVVGLTVLGWAALSVLSVTALLRWPTPDTGSVLFVAEGVIRLAVPVVSLVAVILAVRRSSAARAASEPDQRALPHAESPVAGDEAVPENEAPERLPAAWQADEATGAVWLTADDAAQGRPGLSWSDPSGSQTALSQGWGASGSDTSSSAPGPGSYGPGSYGEGSYGGGSYDASEPDRPPGAEDSAPAVTPRPLPPPADADDDLR